MIKGKKMKLIKALAISSIFLTINILAATISGNIYLDTNENGSQDVGETCPFSAEAWIKAYNVDQDGMLTTQVDETTCAFSFEISVNHEFRFFVDDNGDSNDLEPTPLANTQFRNPLSGEYTRTLDGTDIDDLHFGLELAEVCKCDGDGNIIKAPIDIDGNMTEWAAVFLDPDNTQCDSGYLDDYDINRTVNGDIQSTGRNLLQFSRTVHSTDDTGFAYGATRRLGSSTNTEEYLFYRGGYDGKMHTTTPTNGNIVLAAHWHGSNQVVDMEICDYVEVTPGGDPMFWQEEDVGTDLEPHQYPADATVPAEWVGQADGYTIHGTVTNCRENSALAFGVGSEDGYYMEYMVSMELIKLNPVLGFPTYHVSTSNTVVNATHPPAGIDDNMGPCALAVPQIALYVNKTVDNDNPYAGENVTYTITVTNSGDATSSVDANDTLPVGMTYVSYNGTDWTCTNIGQLVSCSYAGILGGGTSSSVDIIASVDAGTQGDILTNNVCVASDENATLVCDDENITVASNILQVSKGVSDETPYINSIVTYEINVTNTGPNIAYNVVLNDVLPTGIHYIDYTGADWACTETSPDVIDCNYTMQLNVGEMTTVIFGVDVNATVGVDSNNTACANSDDNTTDVCDSAILTPKATPTDVVLSMAKGVDENTPLIGETITYTMSVTNVGTTQATDVNITDILPVELDFVSASAGGSYDAGTRTISWLIPTLDSNASEILTITATVNTNAVVDTSVNNEVCAVADQNLTSQCADINFTPRDPIVTMLINKIVDNELPKVGEDIIYTIVVTNSGTDTANNVVVTDPLPSGVTEISSSSLDYIDPTWTVGTLAPGASAELNITVSIDADTEGDLISNEACVISDEDTTSECDDANLTVGHVILQIMKLADDPNPAELEDFNYTIIISNQGDINATNITVTDTLPDDVSFISAGGNGWSCDATGQVLTCTNDTLTLLPDPDPGTSFDVNVRVDANTSGQTLINTACTWVDENTTEVCVDRNITVEDDLDLAVTKIVNNPTPDENETIVYTITVTNNGLITATGVTINEGIIDSPILHTISTDGDMIDDYTWDVGILAPGETATLHVTATVNIGTTGETYLNHATLGSLDQDDTDDTNNVGTATITIACACDNISSDGSPAMNKTAAVLMILMTALIGLFFVRREEKYNTNKS